MRVLDPATSRLPLPLRTTVDWLATLVVAIAVVLTFEAEVAKPFRVPTSSMEPTLHCAKPGDGCVASGSGSPERHGKHGTATCTSTATC